MIEVPVSPKIAMPKHDNGLWLFPEQMGIGMGFTYIVRDNYLERFYLGKKLYHGHGKLNKGVPTQWRKYKSSSKLLKEMFTERPMKEFDFICLEQYETKGALAYSETWSLCLVEAPTTDNWYNKRIESITWNVKEPITDIHKERLSRVVKMEDFSEER